MSRDEIGEDSPIPKFIYLKILCWDGVESLTTLEEGEFKVPIDGCINFVFQAQEVLNMDKGKLERHSSYLHIFSWFEVRVLVNFPT